MTQDRQIPLHALPLQPDWSGAPDVTAAVYPETGAAWQAALSGLLDAGISLDKPGEGQGTIWTAQRPNADLYRVRLATQSVTVRPDERGTGTLTLIALLSGQVDLYSHAAHHRLVAGDAFIAPSWDAYRLDIDGELDLAVVRVPLWWMLSLSKAGSATSWIGAQNLNIPEDFFLTPVLMSAAHALLWHDGVDYRIEQAGQLLGSALIHTMSAATPPPQLTFRTRTRFAHLYSYIMLHVSSEDLSPTSAAAAMKISLRTLHQTCADRGTTFSRLVQDMRISYAAHLLRNGSENVSEVAFATGFRSLSHFCRLFKQTYGVSARRYRFSRPD